MLSIFPGMSAVVLTYGLIADPATIERHLWSLSGILPDEATKLLSGQLDTLISAPREKLGIGLIISVLFAVWSAMSATSAIMQALTAAYEGAEQRGVLRFYGTSLLLTVGLAVFGIFALLLIAGIPAAVATLPMPEAWRQALPFAEWPILAALTPLALGTLYRVAPHRKGASWDFLRPGTIAASLLWLVGSAGFSFYAAHFGSYDRTYGSLSAIVVLLVWFYASAYIVLAGAELNREITRPDRAPPPP
jgi:membrane protein